VNSKAKNLNEIYILILITLIAALALYFPFRNNISVLTRYWDGPNYMYVAKTLYSIPENNPLSFYGIPPSYFSCHLPFYPLLIRFMSFFSGYEIGMLLVSIISSIYLSVIFYLFVKELKLVEQPFWAAILLLFLPPRILIYRNLGATEGIFLALLITSLLCFYKKKYALASLFAGLASITRIFGILLIPIYLTELFFEHYKNRKHTATKNIKGYIVQIYSFLEKLVCDRNLWIIYAGGIPLFLTFFYYQHVFGDFFAYMSYNSRLFGSYPFEIFVAYSKSANTHSAEFYLLMYLLYGFGLYQIRNRGVLFKYSLVYFLLMLFVIHTDLSRCLLAIAPFTIVIPLSNLFQTRRSKLLMLVVIPLVYIYSWNMIPGNLLNAAVYENLVRVLQGYR